MFTAQSFFKYKSTSMSLCSSVSVLFLARYSEIATDRVWSDAGNSLFDTVSKKNSKSSEFAIAPGSNISNSCSIVVCITSNIAFGTSFASGISPEYKKRTFV